MGSPETATIESADGAERPVDRRMLIDGGLVAAARSFPSLNPATGEVLGYAPDATIYDAERAVAAARRAFDRPTGQPTWTCGSGVSSSCTRHSSSTGMSWGS